MLYRRPGTLHLKLRRSIAIYVGRQMATTHRERAWVWSLTMAVSFTGVEFSSLENLFRYKTVFQVHFFSPKPLARNVIVRSLR